MARRRLRDENRVRGLGDARIASAPDSSMVAVGFVELLTIAARPKRCLAGEGVGHGGQRHRHGSREVN